MILREFKADLHIHTCLSPCAELTMMPTSIVRAAVMQDLNIIGICDHNSAENVAAVKKVGEKVGLQVLGGMEMTSSEEVHVLGFFCDGDALMEMQDVVHRNLAGKNDEDAFGMQLIVDEHDEPMELSDRLLIGATNLTVEEIVESIHSLGGIAIASHIDREAFSVIGQLGFIPPDLALDALELSVRCEPGMMADYEGYGLPFVRSSDAHFLPDIGKASTTFLLNAPSLLEIKMAFQGVEGREIRS